MRTLIVGVGAIGGVIATRLLSADRHVALATRDAGSAELLRRDGLLVFGKGGGASVRPREVRPFHEYLGTHCFDLVILATKAAEAISIAADLISTLRSGGVLLPVQNGGVPLSIAHQVGLDMTLGGLSNLGATMHNPGVYEQRNDGSLLIGEVAGGLSSRSERVRDWLALAVDTRLTPDFNASCWAKLLINCSVTTLGAIAGTPMRGYIDDHQCRRLFLAVYREGLEVARSSGVELVRMIVDPIPPSSRDNAATLAWIRSVQAAYGDIKPSMLQDIERGRPTEIQHINGYVVQRSEQLGMSAPINAHVVAAVESISRGTARPSLRLLQELAGDVRHSFPGPCVDEFASKAST